ncbi:hypothetical protein HanXRQr2_Chr07g0305461 [Helianthus annuus]|uniref:Uncharacterized protein n=1 Tax=Helianthus annuus TaxID=4232 RepID=A0A9K3NGK8_HELAN|nr:hypothetical protein HanXRQr2_Chr07g0305461 [Helianthus annuus]KAJ0903300.1 hypothetical protein HanPSC8_Chr08g0347481 [Helianthus annuus]
MPPRFFSKTFSLYVLYQGQGRFYPYPEVQQVEVPFQPSFSGGSYRLQDHQPLLPPPVPQIQQLAVLLFQGGVKKTSRPRPLM